MTLELRRFIGHAGAACAGVLALAGAAAQDVYRSVDGDGAVEFSDRPSAGAERVDGVSTNPAGGASTEEAQAEVERIGRVADEMARERRARTEKRAAEARARARSAAEAAQAAPPIGYGRTYYPPVGVVPPIEPVPPPDVDVGPPKSVGFGDGGGGGLGGF